MSAVITSGSRVLLDFALRLENGDTVDSTFGRKPAELVVGDGRLLPSFEKVLYGLRAGDSRTEILPPEQAFGEHRQENLQQFERHRFASDMTLEPGLVINFNDAGGNGLPGVVQSVDEQQVTVDFNHPLAGHALSFEVSIIHVDNGSGSAA